jgi:hypothetical protein
MHRIRHVRALRRSAPGRKESLLKNAACPVLHGFGNVYLPAISAPFRKGESLADGLAVVRGKVPRGFSGLQVVPPSQVADTVRVEDAK